MNNYLTRQRDILPEDLLDEPITIIGAGAVGSFTTFFLAKMGFNNLTVIDDDTVDEENMCCSLYETVDVGFPKVQALNRMTSLVTGSGDGVAYSDDKYEAGVFPGIVIMAVDNMEVRRLIFTNHARSYDTKLIVDPRMGAENITIVAMRPTEASDQEAYRKMWHSDTNSLREPCTAKATVYTAGIISGLICKIVKDTITGLPYSRITKFDVKNYDAEFYKTGGRHE